MLIPVLVICVLAILFFVSSIRIIKEYERAAVFRLGQFIAVNGPGLIYLIPILDKAKVIDLNKGVPEWQGLSKSEVDERVKLLVLSDPAR
jgi:regulator of protease activity HflC (stomatin/prohibitin superfamily)